MRDYLTGWFSNISVGLMVGSAIALLIDHKITIEAVMAFGAGAILGLVGLVMSGVKR